MTKKLFAVYGTLKEGYHNNHYLRGAKKLGTGKTEPIYTMHSAGGYPIVRRDGNTSIHYEIWETESENTILNVYSLEGYSGKQGSSRNWYDVDVIETPFGKAEMFVQNKSNDTSTIISNGIW